MPLGSTENRLLDLSWSALGPLLGALVAVLGFTWASLGALLGNFGAILRLWKASRKQKGDNAQIIVLLSVCEGTWLLGGPPWEVPWPLGAVLKRSWEHSTAPMPKTTPRTRQSPSSGSIVRSLARSLVRSVVRSIVRSIVRSMVRSIVRSVDRSIVRSMVTPIWAPR